MGRMTRKLRAALVASAAQALWHFRRPARACGLRDSGTMMRMYGVPAEVATGWAPFRRAGRETPFGTV